MHLDLPPFLVSWLLRITLVSAFLSGYYWIFLRNASFHPYNRRYLLAAAAASLLLPLLYLPAAWPRTNTFIPWTNPVPVSGPSAAGPGSITIVHSTIGAWSLIASAYAFISFLFFLRVLLSFLHIIRLSRKYACIWQKDVRFYHTDAPGTPFSFGNRLFWNSRIPLGTVTGKAILRHEMAHIHGRHTLDILFLEVIRSLFWINPVFHWMLRETRIIHEFLADRQALAAAADPTEYAECLVWQSAGRHSPTLLTHNFFPTHIKRRITMIIKTHPSPRYLSRVLALPLFFLLFTAFATRQPVSHDYPMTLLRFYNHQLRFPQAALDANRQGVVNFIIKVGDNGKLAAFEARPADFTPPAGQQVLAITVTARPSAQPVTAPDNEGVFWEEVRKASNKLGEDKFQVDEGVYYLRIRFKIEKP